MGTSSEIDRDGLRRKYRDERDKRLRPDGNEQYIEVTGVFEHYVEDPYVEASEREPLFDEVTVAFIGGGFAGLIAGAKLHETGVDDVRIIEKGGDFGGTWYWNRYPGAQCDTAAFVYLPLLEETGHMPSEKYTHAPEILEHSRRIGRHFDLYDHAVFSTEVTSLTWDDDTKRWIIRTNRGDEMRARFVAMGTGPLDRPKLPGIDGIESYRGHSFHTSRWDYDYTGGDPDGAPLDRLRETRVGIIGTGATAVQCIPHLARSAKELYVFQRTPSSIDVRNNHDIDPDWFTTLQPGWQAEWLMNFTTLQTGGFADEDLVKDGWTDIARRIRDKVLSNPNQEFTRDAFMAAYEDSDDEKMNEIRERVDALVTDAETAEALKPWYRQLCKRPCFHDEYLDSYNEPGTHLIDTNGQGVERIDETGVWANGAHYELDCIIFASGFEVGTEFSRRSGFETVGRGGEQLSDHWAEGMQSLHGIHVHGFPNLFVVGLSHGAALISNVPHNYLEAGATIATVIDHALGLDDVDSEVTVEVTPEAERAWVERLHAGAVGHMTNSPDCTPGYYNNEGQSAGRRGILNSMRYPEGPVAYFQYIDRWRSSGQFEGLEFSP